MNATALVLATAVSLLPSPLAATPQAEAPPPTAASRSEAGAGAASGFIHGAVTTRGGTTYRGLLRWGTEEAFWGDLFNSAKEENAYADEVPRRERPRQTVEVFGVRVGVRRDGDVGRQFVARFGDIAEIEADGTGDAVVRLKNGSLVEVSGGANDVEAEVVVWDEAIGKVELPWRKIATITFSPAPAGARPYAARLYGVAKTDAGTFEGFVQWDSQECVSTDVLDGDAEDGRLEIAMGNVRSIVRRGRSSSSVTLNDGRELTLSGTNDVDSSIRGIFVEDPRYGRVKVSWSAFDRLDLREAAGSGPGYEQYAVLGPRRRVPHPLRAGGGDRPARLARQPRDAAHRRGAAPRGQQGRRRGQRRCARLLERRRAADVRALGHGAAHRLRAVASAAAPPSPLPGLNPGARATYSPPTRRTTRWRRRCASL